MQVNISFFFTNMARDDVLYFDELFLLTKKIRCKLIIIRLKYKMNKKETEKGAFYEIPCIQGEA